MPFVFAVTWFLSYSSAVIHDLNACDEKCLVYRQGFKYVEDLLTHYEIVFMSVKHIKCTEVLNNCSQKFFKL
jgi:hypothetical protein